MVIYAVFPFLVLLHLAASEKASITQEAVFASQRPCAQGCFTYSFEDGPAQLAEAIGCDYQNVQNECFCRPDLQTDADAFLQRCVNSACAQSTLDTNSATSIYDAYCTGAGFLRSTSSTPTLGSSTSSSTTLPIPSSSSFQSQQTLQTSQTSSSKTSNSVEDPSSTTNTSETRDPTPTDSTSGGNSDEGGNSLGTSDIIGIVFGIAGFIVTAIGTFFAWKAIKNKKSTRNSAHMEMM